MIQYQIDFLCLNETWLNSSYPNSLLHFPGYQIFRLDRPSTGGGVMILTKNGYKCHLENTLITDTIEIIHIAIDLPSTSPINLVTLYRSPQSNINMFMDNINNFLSNIDYSHLPLILLGDTNIDMSKNNANKKYFINTLNDYGLKLMNTQTTRNTNSSRTLIDVVLANNIASKFINTTNIYNHQTVISDHDLIYFNYKKPRKMNGTPKYITIPQLSSHVLIDQINHEIMDINTIHYEHSNINMLLDNFMAE